MTTKRWATLVQQLHTVGAITEVPAAADCFIDVP
jgi:hypothetical protein